MPLHPADLAGLSSDWALIILGCLILPSVLFELLVRLWEGVLRLRAIVPSSSVVVILGLGRLPVLRRLRFSIFKLLSLQILSGAAGSPTILGFLMIVTWDTNLILFEGFIESTLILEAIGRIKENFVARVTAGHDTKDTARVVVVWEDFVHRLINKVCDEFKSELLRFAFFSLLAIGALMVRHADRFKTLGQAEDILTLWEASASQEKGALL